MIYRFGDCELDIELYELRRGGERSKVEPQVFDLLRFLVVNAHRVVTRDEVVEEIWDGRIVTEATISTCLKAARQAVGDNGRAQKLIKTVHGRGFRFVGDLTKSEAVADDPARNEENGERPWAADKPVLAVLPLDNMSAGDDAYFADGLTEDIITNLSKFRDLLVISRTSTFRFKGREFDIAELRTELHADYFVEGSVRRAGSRVRITAQLVDATTGVHLWADSYDREMEDILAIQDEVTRTIAATLGVKIQDVALRRALKKSPTELDAYDCVLRARHYTTTLTPESHAEARELLEKAVALDPENADAHALLANVYLAEHRFDTNPLPDPIGRALAMAETATRLDPQHAYARCWLAIVHFFRGDNDRFEAEAQRAISLNPNDPETLADIGHFLAFMGEFERGVELSKRALAHLFALKPDFSARFELAKWNTAPDDLEHLLDGLRKAGLKEDGSD